MSSEQSNSGVPRTPSGLAGLDYILGGGFVQNRIHLVCGDPGTGKSTLCMHFLMDGARRGQRVLYATLLQTEQDIRLMAEAHGWSLDGVTLIEQNPAIHEEAAAEQSVFTTSEVELTEATDALLRVLEEHRPQRFVLDSISELEVLVENPHQLLRQMLRLKRKLRELNCTALFTLGKTQLQTNLLETTVHGVINLSMHVPPYGPLRRHLLIPKMRCVEFHGGYHDLHIRKGGIELFPRLKLDSGVNPSNQWNVVPSGNQALDQMLGGGLETGTACLISGTTGAGKSTLASLYVQTAAERGDRSAVFCFDERKEVFLHRAHGLNMPMPRYIEQGLVDLREFNVGDLSPAQFAQIARTVVEKNHVRIMVIDSITGYFNSVGEQRELMVQLHELLSYLGSRGVLTLMIVATHGIGAVADTAVDASYIADTVLMARHFETDGQWRRCIAVLKKRHGRHENAIRELQIGPHGIQIGQPLTDFTGVLAGQPVYNGHTSRLMDDRGLTDAENSP
ncbi:MAG: AAA family ATPase [Phycisphaeraceae bacterium]|nr:AAA family ATPase [Phycisphaeraceae bacterium]